MAPKPIATKRNSYLMHNTMQNQLYYIQKTTVFKQTRKRERNGRRRMAGSGSLGLSIKNNRKRRTRKTISLRRMMIPTMSTSLRSFSLLREREPVVLSIETVGSQTTKHPTTSPTANPSSTRIEMSTTYHTSTLRTAKSSRRGLAQLCCVALRRQER